MDKLFRKPVIIIWIILVFISIILLATKGLQFGVDFSGGTSFQIVLEQPVSSEDLLKTASVISKRLDWTGAKDVKVTPAGSQYLIAQLAESDPNEIAKLKSNILKQGRFEAVLDGNVLFSGDDIINIPKDPTKGYSLTVVDKKTGQSEWSVPFMLSPDAAKRFARMTFHKCMPIGMGGQSDYECDKTFFFIDRPVDSILIMDKALYLEEKEVPIVPESSYSNYISIDEIFAQLPKKPYIVDQNLTQEQVSSLLLDQNSGVYKVIVSPTVSEDVVNKLKELGFKVTILEKPENLPWIWEATGLKSIISLTPGIANMDVPTMESSRFQVFNSLTITGGGATLEEATQRRDELVLILESGSLPIPIESISTETISPYLGKDFLNYCLWIGLLVLLVVAIAMFVRYKHINLALPIILTCATEIIILLGVLSLLSFRLDLAGVTGILATIATGVDVNIIMIDELLKGEKKEQDAQVAKSSFISRLKKAFFIMFASAATMAATMLPIIFFSGGLGKLVGFAVTILLGTVIGILITRPVYAEIAKRNLEVSAQKHEQKGSQSSKGGSSSSVVSLSTPKQELEESSSVFSDSDKK
jgi:preprotein translocase subunit SecD